MRHWRYGDWTFFALVTAGGALLNAGLLRNGAWPVLLSGALEGAFGYLVAYEMGHHFPIIGRLFKRPDED